MSDIELDLSDLLELDQIIIQNNILLPNFEEIEFDAVNPDLLNRKRESRYRGSTEESEWRFMLRNRRLEDELSY